MHVPHKRLIAILALIVASIGVFVAPYLMHATSPITNNANHLSGNSHPAGTTTTNPNTESNRANSASSTGTTNTNTGSTNTSGSSSDKTKTGATSSITQAGREHQGTSSQHDDDDKTAGGKVTDNHHRNTMKNTDHDKPVPKEESRLHPNNSNRQHHPNNHWQSKHRHNQNNGHISTNPKVHSSINCSENYLDILEN